MNNENEKNIEALDFIIGEETPDGWSCTVFDCPIEDKHTHEPLSSNSHANN